MSGIIVLIFRILLALALYGFLGWAFYSIWRDMQINAKKVLTEKPPKLTLRLDDENVKTFNMLEFTIGRDESNELILSDETVSSFHAKIRFHHKQWWVEDMQSTNGTFLNEERIYTPTILVNEDDIILGKIVLNVKIEDKSR